MGMENLPGSSTCYQNRQEKPAKEPQAETEERIAFSILFCLGVKYILLHITQKGGEKVCKRMYDVVNLS